MRVLISSDADDGYEKVGNVVDPESLRMNHRRRLLLNAR